MIDRILFEHGESPNSGEIASFKDGGVFAYGLGSGYRENCEGADAILQYALRFDMETGYGEGISYPIMDEDPEALNHD